MKVKLNFDEAQKPTWKEINCLYGLIKIITSNYISELLKMQLESRSRNVHTKGTRSGFISTHAVITQKSIKGSHIGKPRICARLWLLQSNHCSIIVHVHGSSLTYILHINHNGQDRFTNFFSELQYFGPNLRLARTKTAIPIRSLQNADCRLDTKRRLRMYTVFPSDT